MLLSGGEGQPRITELWRTAGVCPLFAAERGVGVTRRVWAEGGDGSRSPRIRGLLPLLISRASTMSEPESCCRVSDAYCDRCDLLVGLASLHVIGEAGRGWRAGRDDEVGSGAYGLPVSRGPSTRR